LWGNKLFKPKEGGKSQTSGAGAAEDLTQNLGHTRQVLYLLHHWAAALVLSLRMFNLLIYPKEDFVFYFFLLSISGIFVGVLLFVWLTGWLVRQGLTI
jgi:hypothetical protein